MNITPRNFELEQLSQGKYDIKKFIRKTKKMRDTAFEEYFKAVYPRQHGVTVDDDDECFENGEYVGPRSKSIDVVGNTVFYFSGCFEFFDYLSERFQSIKS